MKLTFITNYVAPIIVAVAIAGCNTPKGKYPTPEEFPNYNKEKQVAPIIDDLPKKGKERDRVLSIAIARDRLAIKRNLVEMTLNGLEIDENEAGITLNGLEIYDIKRAIKEYGAETAANTTDISELNKKYGNLLGTIADMVRQFDIYKKKVDKIKGNLDTFGRVSKDNEHTGMANTDGIVEAAKSDDDLFKKYVDLAKENAALKQNTKQQFDELKEEYRTPLLKIAQDNMVNLRAMITEYKTDKAEHEAAKSKSDAKIKELERVVKELTDAKPIVEVVPLEPKEEPFIPTPPAEAAPLELELSPVPEVKGITY